MNIVFAELPPPLRQGGIEHATRALEAALREQGHHVSSTETRLLDGPLPTLVHFHGLWHPAHLGLAKACRQRHIPHLISPHGMLEPWAFRKKAWKKVPYFHLLEKPRLRQATGLLATSPMEAAHLRQLLPESPLHILPLGMATPRTPDYEAARQRLQILPNERLLLYLSRLHEKKGLHLLLEALATLQPTTTQPLRLVIIGDGPAAYLQHCKTQASHLRQQHLKIEWHPAIWDERKWDYLHSADLFCLPSHSENFGIAVLEALQCGTPILVTEGMPWKHATDKGYGMLTQPDTRAIAQTLQTFYHTWQWTPAQRAAASAWTQEHYLWQHLVHRYLHLYQSLCP